LTQEDVLRRVADALEEVGLPYMVTGSLASSLHGAPRMSQDADLVAEADEERVRRFVRRLGDAFYADEEAAVAAVRARDLFNVVHLETGLKVDVIVKKDRPFSAAEFARRATWPLAGRPAHFATPEDVILSKLEWRRAGGSDRQYADALEVARVHADRLDWAYLERWAGEIGVADLARRLRAET
jgi:hypothetical protein